MHKDQFAVLQTVNPDTSVSVRDYSRTFGIPATDNRTLLYGYNVERETWHVYLEGGEIHRIIYTSRGVQDYKHMEHWPLAQTLVPNKRLYPERTEYWFANLLKRKGAHLSFTTWKDEGDLAPVPTVRGLYHGLTAADFPEIRS